MKYLLLLFISINIFAVSSGDRITAIKFNNSTFSIGDIKTSILTKTQFETIHGDCWIQLNNESVSDIDITGSDLAVLIQKNSIKSSAGRFLRSKGGNSASNVGDIQEDALKSHTHEHVKYGQTTSTGQYGIPPQGSNSTPQYGTTSDASTGPSVETRPVNLTVNTFIKINNTCH